MKQQVSIIGTALAILVDPIVVLALASADQRIVLRLTPIFTDIYRPARIKSNQAGRLFVLSRGDHSISVYDREKHFLRRVGIIGQGPGELFGPRDFAVAPDESIWVADRQNDRVQVFAADGRFELQFKVEAPSSVALLRGGEEAVVVSDTDEHLMRVYSRKGELLRTVDGLVPMQVKDPTMHAFLNRGRVTVDLADNVYYMFIGVSPPRIRRYSSAGGVVDIFPDGEGLKARVREVRPQQDQSIAIGDLSIHGTLNAAAIDPATGHVWVVPTALETYVYTATGSKLATYQWRDVNDEIHGAQDLWLTNDGQGLLISGGRCFSFALPAAQRD